MFWKYKEVIRTYSIYMLPTLHVQLDFSVVFLVLIHVLFGVLSFTSDLG